MVRQINKGYSELQVMHLASNFWRDDGPVRGITGFKVTSADTQGNSWEWLQFAPKLIGLEETAGLRYIS